MCAFGNQDVRVTRWKLVVLVSLALESKPESISRNSTVKGMERYTELFTGEIQILHASLSLRPARDFLILLSAWKALRSFLFNGAKGALLIIY